MDPPILKKKMSYRDIEKSLEIYFDSDTQNKFSSEIDILTTYVKGQKHLYIHAKHYTQGRLHCLMIPALVFTALITIIAPFVECRVWSGGLISGLNALIALLISMINYLKLESSVEMYLQMANHYDQLETSLEMANSRLLFLEDTEEKKKLVLRKIREVEIKVTDMKESNSLLLPEHVKRLFPVICHINIFLFIKKMEVFKRSQILKYRDLKNEIRKLRPLKTFDTMIELEPDSTKKERLLFLYDAKTKVKNDIADYRSAYGYMDELFTREIKAAEEYRWYWFCNRRKEIDLVGYGKNPVLDFIFQQTK